MQRHLLAGGVESFQSKRREYNCSLCRCLFGRVLRALYQGALVFFVIVVGNNVVVDGRAADQQLSSTAAFITLLAGEKTTHGTKRNATF